jgi:hypothetical protein
MITAAEWEAFLDESAGPQVGLKSTLTHILCGNYGAANTQSEEAIALADEKGLSAWKGWAMMNSGCVSALTNKPADAVETMRAGIAVWRSTGGTILLPIYLSNLAMAYAELSNANDASTYHPVCRLGV